MKAPRRPGRLLALLLAPAVRAEGVGSSGSADIGRRIADRISMLDQRTADLAIRVVAELRGFATKLEPEKLLMALAQLFNRAAALPMYNPADLKAHNDQVALVRFTEEATFIFRADEEWRRTKAESVNPMGHLVHAMLTATAASLPLCRWVDTCLVHKVSLALWRFAMSGTEHLMKAGVGWRFFNAMQPHLPPIARWQTPWQCPPQFDAALESRPVWRLENLPKGSSVHRLFLALRAGAREVREELRSGILSDEGEALVKDPAWSGLYENGRWIAFSLYRSEGFNGRLALPRQLDPLRCRLVPRTCRLLEDARVPAGAAGHLPALQGTQEVVDFLRADPGTVVTSHTASTNSRLTVQLCLTGCNEEGTSAGSSYLQVGPEKIYWRFGEPVVFDDSFLHSVHISPHLQEPRWVLSAAVMHPSIDNPDGFAEHFASRTADVGDPRQRATEEDGGPPPPALEEGAEAFPEAPLSFRNGLPNSVLLYAAMWGPRQDGPSKLLGEALGLEDRPQDQQRALALPPLAHRTRLSARNLTDGQELAAWRVDARKGGPREFALPQEHHVEGEKATRATSEV